MNSGGVEGTAVGQSPLWTGTTNGSYPALYVLSVEPIDGGVWLHRSTIIVDHAESGIPAIGQFQDESPSRQASKRVTREFSGFTIRHADKGPFPRSECAITRLHVPGSFADSLQRPLETHGTHQRVHQFFCRTGGSQPEHWALWYTHLWFTRQGLITPDRNSDQYDGGYDSSKFRADRTGFH